MGVDEEEDFRYFVKELKHLVFPYGRIEITLPPEASFEVTHSLRFHKRNCAFSHHHNFMYVH